MTDHTLRWQKFAHVDAVFPTYELVDHDNAIVLDVTRTEDGDIKVTFHESALGRTLDFSVLERLMTQARVWLEAAEPDRT